ncbi:MAG: FAD-dependent oxidoreductase [Burkholderiales bacterium]|nr:FAD-dependent oxidoreductase [Burkholderiales bacterium]
MQRRHLLQHGLALGLTPAFLTQSVFAQNTAEKAQVIVIGGGYGGATAAKYIRLLSGYKISVVLIEPQTDFISCPMSNLVLGGSKNLAELTTSYAALSSKHGVTLVHDYATAIDTQKKTVALKNGSTLSYDKLIVSPGVDMNFNNIEGLQAANASGQILQAWKAGAETTALRQQLQAMPDGGVFAITVPEAPYKCPPGPYERASQVAHYFKQAKPTSKVLILDANPDVTSKGPLFKKFWSDNYKDMIEFRPNHKVVAVDAKTNTLKFDAQDSVRADVLNVLPDMRAGAIAMQTGLATVNARWCGINYQTFESLAAKDVHVLGDAILAAPAMPKSGHMANSHAKVAAAAVVAQLSELAVNPAPFLTNTCYSYVSDNMVIHVASVHQFNVDEKTYKTVPGSGGVSAEANTLEATYAWSWAQNIWADSLL